MEGENLNELLELAVGPPIDESADMSDEEIKEEIERLVDKNPLLVPDGKPISLDEAFQLGARIEYVTQIRETRPTVERTDDRGVVDVLEQIEDVLKYSDLDSAVEEQIRSEKDALREKYEPDAMLDEDDAAGLIERADQWGHLLQAELSSEKRLPVSRRGLFDVETAMENPSALFEPGVWDWLPEMPKNDITEACQCLAVESSTGAMILSLRAVEECLRRWYVHEEDEVAKVEKTPWGGVLRDLQDIYDDYSERPAVLTNLDYLRMKRNQVNHPDKSPEWSEAEATLFIVRNTINEIRKQMTDDGDE